MAKRSSLTPASLTVIVLLAAGGLVAVYFGKKLWAQPVAPEAQPNIQRIAVAHSVLKPGHVIRDSDIVVAPIDRDKFEIGRTALIGREVLVGRVVKTTIKPAVPIVSEQLYGAGEYPALDPAPGKQAASIFVSEATSMVDGLIKPGEYVDVHFIPNENVSGARNGISVTLLKGIRVIAINRNFATSTPTNDRDGDAVTLELSPRQTNVMNLAQARGRISLTHNPTGHNEVQVENGDPTRVKFEDLLNLPETGAPFRTRTYRSGQPGLNSFEDNAPVPNEVRSTPQPPKTVKRVPNPPRTAATPRLPNLTQPTQPRTRNQPNQPTFRRTVPGLPGRQPVFGPSFN